jgi:hypothetical protein
MNTTAIFSMRTFTLLIVLSALVETAGFAQPSASTELGLRVTLKTDKDDYAVGEPVRITVLLQNRGTSPVYVAKSFSWAGFGVAGFSVSVEQLTGKKSDIGCGIAGSGLSVQDPRTPEQVLREDYLRLPPGAMVGFEDQYTGCSLMHPGTYEITATYSAQALSLDKVRLVSEKNGEIVRGEFRSKPLTFRVHDGK